MVYAMMELQEGLIMIGTMLKEVCVYKKNGIRVYKFTEDCVFLCCFGVCKMVYYK